MKIALCILSILVLVQSVFPANLGILPEITRPLMLGASESGLYVFDGTTVYRYDAEKLTLLNKFGKKGEGPGEMKVTPYYTNSMVILPDAVFIDSMDKVSYFGWDGKLIKEVRKGSGMVTQTVPVGKNFVVKKVDRSDNKNEFITLGVSDAKMNSIKEIARIESPVQLKTVQLIMDSLYFWVVEDKIFVDNSKEGFVIDVFDQTGKKLTSIRHELPKVTVTQKDKNAALELYKSNPIVKEIGFENLKKNIDFQFPEFFPAIQSIVGANGQLYVKTFKVVDNKEEYIVMDLKGKIIKHIHMPYLEKPEFMSQINGIDLQCYAFFKNKFFYLNENDDEDWELHVETVK